VASRGAARPNRIPLTGADCFLRAFDAEIARWEAEASEEDRQNTALLVISDTITQYWNLAYLNQGGVLYPTSDFQLQIYTRLPIDLEAVRF